MLPVCGGVKVYKEKKPKFISNCDSCIRSFVVLALRINPAIMQ